MSKHFVILLVGSVLFAGVFWYYMGAFPPRQGVTPEELAVSGLLCIQLALKQMAAYVILVALVLGHGVLTKPARERVSAESGGPVNGSPRTGPAASNLGAIGAELSR